MLYVWISSRVFYELSDRSQWCWNIQTRWVSRYIIQLPKNVDTIKKQTTFLYVYWIDVIFFFSSLFEIKVYFEKEKSRWRNEKIYGCRSFFFSLLFFYYVNDKRFKRTTYDASYEVRSLLPFSLKGKEFQAAVTLYTQIVVVVQWIRGVKK